MAGNYGFTMTMDGNVAAALLSIQKQLETLSSKVDNTTKKVEHGFEGMGGAINKVKHELLGLFAVDKLFETAKEVAKVTAEFEGFENRIKFASLGAQDFQKNMGFLNQEVQQLHLPKEQLYDSFSEMQAGLVGTGIEGEKLRVIFDGISTAAATLHLPNDQLQRTLYDLKEIGEIGLNKRIERSLSTALPGIGDIVKKSFGKSMDELQKEGITGAAFLEKLGPALKNRFKDGLKNFGDSLQGAKNDMENAWTDLALKIGSKLEPMFKKIYKAAKEFADSMTTVWHWVKANADTLRTLGVVVGVIISGLIVYNTILKINAGLQALNAWWQAAGTTVMIINALATEGLASAWAILNAAMLANPLVWIIGLIVGLIVVVMVLWDKFKIFRQIVGGVFGFFKQEIMTTVHVFQNFAQIVYDIFTGQFKKAFEDGKKMITDFKNDVTKGMVDAVKEGAEAAGNSTFRFGNLLKFGTGQTGPSNEFGKDRKPGGTGVTDNAINTSKLSGANGGLGQAKIINIKIDTMQKIVTTDNRQLKERGADAVEIMLRTVNNIAYSQSSVQ